MRWNKTIGLLAQIRFLLVGPMLKPKTVFVHTAEKLYLIPIGDVNWFWSSRRKLKSSRQIDADGTAVCHAEQAWHPLRGVEGSGINGAQSCILGLSWHLILLLKLHFFCTIFLIYFFSFFFYICLITCIIVYSLLFEKAVQWTLFISLFARRHHRVFDKGAPV